MSLARNIRKNLVLPVVCAPMTGVSGPELVAEACKAGMMAAFPRSNVGTGEQFEDWLRQIRSSLDGHRAEFPSARIGPLAVNLTNRGAVEAARDDLAICARYGVEVIISVLGNPKELAAIVHDWGGTIFHDVTSIRFAEKAIEAGVDGLVCIGSGGGGHSGTLSPFAFIPKIRSIWDGTIIYAGNVSTGAAVRAAEVLGADLAYMGTRFIATQESRADPLYKQMIVEGTAADLTYTDRVSSIPANWMKASLRHVGLDPENLPSSPGPRRYEHLPDGVRPWHQIWSCGQGIELIDDIPTVAQLANRLRHEYLDACAIGDMSEAARSARDLGAHQEVI